MFIKNGKRINVHAPFETEDGTRYAFVPAGMYTELGIEEIPDPQQPEDYSDETYYRTEQDEAPYVIYTRKSDEQLEQLRVAKLQQQIDALEKDNMLPRVVREYMLLNAEMVAAANGINPMENIGYRKVKELDQTISALRSQLP